MEKFTRADIEQAIRDFLLVQRRRDLKLYEAMIYRIERLKECEKQNVAEKIECSRCKGKRTIRERGLFGFGKEQPCPKCNGIGYIYGNH